MEHHTFKFKVRESYRWVSYLIVSKIHKELNALSVRLEVNRVPEASLILLERVIGRVVGEGF
jgi:hypothetical protein